MKGLVNDTNERSFLMNHPKVKAKAIDNTIDKILYAFVGLLAGLLTATLFFGNSLSLRN